MLRRRRPATRLTLAAAALVAAGCAAALPLGVGSGLARQATDAFFPRGRVDERLLVVAIDRRSLGSLGGRSWTLREVADLVDALAGAGAGVIVLDIDAGRLRDTGGDPDAARADEVLAGAVRRAGNVVLAVPPATLERPPGGLPRIRERGDVLVAVLRAARARGLANLTQDAGDRVVRSVPLVAQDGDGTLVPGLTLAALGGLHGFPAEVTVRPGRVDFGDRRVPTTRSGELRVSYAAGLTPGAPAARQVSAVEVLRGQVPADRLAGRTVLVGVTDGNVAASSRAPVGPDGELASVYVHANALNTILTGAYLTPVPAAETVAWVVILALVVALAAARLPLWLAPLPAAVAAGLYLLVAAVRFGAGQLMDLPRPLAAVAAAFVAAVLVRAALELRQRHHVSRLFAQYVPATVAGQLLDEDRVEAAAAGARLRVAVLFCDLRGFTPIAETMEPAVVRDLLEAYYQAMTRIVFDHGGTVMQYVGDEVFAVFGAPIPDPDAAAKAVGCAQAMQAETPHLGTRLAEASLPPVGYGIGVHLGEVVAAHVGNDIRRQYAVVGDTVNVGSRLCSRAQAGEVVMSEVVLAAIDRPPPVEPLGPVELKGKRDPLPVHRLVPAASEETQARS